MDLEGYKTEIKSLHDRLDMWCNYLLGFIGKEIGEEAVGRAMGGLCNDIYRERFLPFKKMTPKERFENLCRSQVANFTKFETEEDDKSYRIIVKECGSGGMIKREGLDKKYGAITSKAYPWNFDRPGVPYYCSHASFFNKFFKEFRVGIEVIYNDDYCVYVVYK